MLLLPLEKGQGFVVAATLEKMRQPWVYRRRELSLQSADLLGDRPQPVEMSRRIASIPFAIGDHGPPFAQGRSKGFLNGG